MLKKKIFSFWKNFPNVSNGSPQKTTECGPSYCLLKFHRGVTTTTTASTSTGTSTATSSSGISNSTSATASIVTNADSNTSATDFLWH